MQIAQQVAIRRIRETYGNVMNIYESTIRPVPSAKHVRNLVKFPTHTPQIYARNNTAKFSFNYELLNSSKCRGWKKSAANVRPPCHRPSN